MLQDQVLWAVVLILIVVVLFVAFANNAPANGIQGTAYGAARISTAPNSQSREQQYRQQAAARYTPQGMAFTRPMSAALTAPLDPSIPHTGTVTGAGQTVLLFPIVGFAASNGMPVSSTVNPGFSNVSLLANGTNTTNIQAPIAFELYSNGFSLLNIASFENYGFPSTLSSSFQNLFVSSNTSGSFNVIGSNTSSGLVPSWNATIPTTVLTPGANNAGNYVIAQSLYSDASASAFVSNQLVVIPLVPTIIVQPNNLNVRVAYTPSLTIANQQSIQTVVVTLYSVLRPFVPAGSYTFTDIAANSASAYVQIPYQAGTRTDAGGIGSIAIAVTLSDGTVLAVNKTLVAGTGGGLEQNRSAPTSITIFVDNAPFQQSGLQPPVYAIDEFFFYTFV